MTQPAGCRPPERILSAMTALPAELPPGRRVKLPGRGSTWIWESPGPVGAPTLVLLHGWTSTAALNWRHCFPELAKQYHVIAMDQRGHGRGVTTTWNRLRPFSLEACADDVACLIEELGCGPVIAVGYSMGGPIAQLLWRRHPESVSGLVMCATAAAFDGRIARAGALRLAGIGVSAALALVPPKLRQRCLWAYFRCRSDNPAERWELEEWTRAEPGALVQAGAALTTYDARSWVGEIDVPSALVITGGDRTVSPARQWSLARAIPRAEAVCIPADHRACVNDTEAFVPALVQACDLVAAGILERA